MKVVELYYTQVQIAALLGNRTTRWAIERIKAGDFGSAVVKDGDEYLVPASAVNSYLEARRLFPAPGIEPIPARSEGELRRKAALRRGKESGNATSPDA